MTGATGFIGRNALAPLVEAGHEVHAVSRGEREGAGVEWHRADLLSGGGPPIVAEVEPDLLLHLGWYVQPARFWNAPENVRWVEASLELLRAFAAAGGRRAVLAGTSAEYDWGAAAEPCNELQTPLRPATLYGAAKHALHTVGAAYADEARFELAWGRVFFLYGPCEPDGRLVRSVARALLAGEPVATTAGEQVRDFMHVQDVAAAFTTLLASNVTGPVNIGSGDPVTVRTVVNTLAEAAGRPDLLRPGELPDREGDPPRLVADVTRLREEVGFAPRIGLTAGVRSTLDSLRD